MKILPAWRACRRTWKLPIRVELISSSALSNTSRIGTLSINDFTHSTCNHPQIQLAAQRMEAACTFLVCIHIYDLRRS